MRIEITKVLPEIQFYLSFGVSSSNPEAVLRVNQKLTYLEQYARSLADYPEFMEDTRGMWNKIFRLSAIAEDCGFKYTENGSFSRQK
jgi:hypothetical protein